MGRECRFAFLVSGLSLRNRHIEGIWARGQPGAALQTRSPIRPLAVPPRHIPVALVPPAEIEKKMA